MARPNLPALAGLRFPPRIDPKSRAHSTIVANSNCSGVPLTSNAFVLEDLSASRTSIPGGDAVQIGPNMPTDLASEATPHSPDSLPTTKFAAARRRLIDSLEHEARLSTAGEGVVRTALDGALRTQQQMAELLAAHPEIERIPVDAPVFITGLLRSGTTVLHNLLAQVPGLRAPHLWELLAAADRAPEPELVRRATAYVEEYYRTAPAFRAIHPLDARHPEECHRLTGVTFTSDIYSLRYRVPSYTEWLAGQDRVPVYRYHRTLLRCILWRQPAAVPVLKCPSHLWHTQALATVYPGARLIRLHRDPATALASVCSLTAVVRAARSDQVDPAEIGRYWFDHAATALDRTRPTALEHGQPVLDIRYADLVGDPVATVAKVCRFLTVPFEEDTRRAVTGMLAADPREKYGAHHYSLDDFGLDRARVEERFSRYIDEFDL